MTVKGQAFSSRIDFWEFSINQLFLPLILSDQGAQHSQNSIRSPSEGVLGALLLSCSTDLLQASSELSIDRMLYQHTKQTLGTVPLKSKHPNWGICIWTFPQQLGLISNTLLKHRHWAFSVQVFSHLLLLDPIHHVLALAGALPNYRNIKLVAAWTFFMS